MDCCVTEAAESLNADFSSSDESCDFLQPDLLVWPQPRPDC